MNKNKDLFIRGLASDGNIPSHLEKEMFEQMTVLKKQMNAIKQILEVSNEK